MTPTGVMQYLRLQTNQKTGKYLSNSLYKTKGSAIHPLLHVHWGQSGWNEEFITDLDILWRGFTCFASQERATAVAKTKRRAKRKHAELEEDNRDEDEGNAECNNKAKDVGDEDDNNISVVVVVEEDGCNHNK